MVLKFRNFNTCEAMGEFLESEYGIIGAEMDIPELMYLQTRDN